MSRNSFDAIEHFTELNRIPLSLRLGSHRVDLIYWGLLGRKWWRNYLHVHSFFEICYAFRGRGSFFIGERKHRVRSGEMFIARPGEPHEIISDRRKPLGIYFWAYSLAQDRKSATSDAAADSIDRLLDLFDSPRQPSEPVMKVGPAMQQTLALLTQEVIDRRPGYTRSIEGLVAKLILDTARAAAPQTGTGESIDPAARDPAQAVAQTAIRYLRDNLAQQFELRDVAAQVNLSERQLSRVFQKVTGSTILAYLTNLRMERARQLLLDREIPIKQIAREVGYPDTRYFTTLFGKKTGATPASFRRSGGTRFLRKSPIARGFSGKNARSR